MRKNKLIVLAGIALLALTAGLVVAAVGPPPLVYPDYGMGGHGPGDVYALNNPPSGPEYYSPAPPEPGLDLEPGLIERSPEMARLVRDIVALRQINRANLRPKQIEKILPIIKGLAKDQDELLEQARDRLVEERERLLRENSPRLNERSLSSINEPLFAYRERIEDAQAALARSLTSPQAQILGSLIAPTGPYAPARANPAGVQSRRASKQNVGVGFLDRRLSPPRFLFPDLKRLVSLLEDKLEALSAEK